MDDLNKKDFEEDVHEVNFEEDKSTNYTFKTTEGTKAKADRLATEANLSKKDFFKLMVDLAEIKISSRTFSDFTKDIEAFQGITEQMLRLFTNVIERASSTRENDNKNWCEKFEGKEEDLNKLKEELNNYKRIVAEAKELKKQSEAANNDLTIKLQDSQKSLENVQLLSDEYKFKNDFLTAQLSKFKQYESQNIELEEQISTITETANREKVALERSANDLKRQIEELEQVIAFEEKQKPLEIKEAVLNTKAELQEQIAENNRKHQETINEYLKKIEQLREANELALSKQEQAFIKEREANELTLNKQEQLFTKEREAYEAKIKALETKLAEKDEKDPKKSS